MSVGIALVGTGFAVNVQLPAFRLVPGAEVRALVGRDAARTEALGRRHRIPTATTRLVDVLEDPRVDLVCVTTPPDLHRAFSIEALAAGKHVLCEKPLALDAQEARDMERAAAESHRLALVDHQMRFSPAVLKLRHLLAEGYLGTPLHADVEVAGARWLDRAKPFSWWQESARGGGALGALGSHVVDLLRWLFGDVRSVAADLATFITERTPEGALQPRHVDSDDWAALLFRFRPPSRLRAVARLSAVTHRGGGFHVVVHGTEGTLRLDTEGRLCGSRREPGRDDAPFEELGGPDSLSAATRKLLPDSPWAVAFAHAAPAIVAAVAAGEAPPNAATFADGRAVQEVLDAARRAALRCTWADPVGPLADPPQAP
jgi:predicted dehydrogenase